MEGLMKALETVVFDTPDIFATSSIVAITPPAAGYKNGNVPIFV
jgi:hypothetical protein